MKIKDKDFDELIHDPVFMAKKLQRYATELEKCMISAYKAFDKLKTAVLSDMVLHRQNLLNSIKDEKRSKKTNK